MMVQRKFGNAYPQPGHPVPGPGQRFQQVFTEAVITNGGNPQRYGQGLVRRLFQHRQHPGQQQPVNAGNQAQAFGHGQKCPGLEVALRRGNARKRLIMGQGTVFTGHHWLQPQ